MPFYESVVITRQDLTPAKTDEVIKKYIGVVEKDGGKVVRTENWGLRTFAYKIKKNKKGYYTLLNIEAPGTTIIEMERLMRFDEDVLRSLTIKVDALSDKPSVMMDKSRKADLETPFTSEEV